MTLVSKNKIDVRWEWLESKDDWYIYDESIQKILETELKNGNLSVKRNLRKIERIIRFIFFK